MLPSTLNEQGKSFFHTGHGFRWQNYAVTFLDQGVSVVMLSNSSNFESVARELAEKTIGISLDNRDEFRPQAYGDGIRAEVGYDKSAFSERPPYDYWVLRSNGDFYLLQSLFEDDRTENKVFFNTRIVRVTESLLFGANLYEQLGVTPETRVSIRVVHRGLAGRELTSSSSNRRVRSAATREGESQAEIVTALGSIRPELVDSVRKITEPLFMLFDFREFSEEVYGNIVRRFEAGEVT